MGKLKKEEARKRRHMRLRKKISGTVERPRMAVFTSNKHMYVQFINDSAGHTMAAISTLSEDFKKSGAKVNVKGSEILGELAADRAKSADISKAVLDRCGFSYSGKIKAIADSARKKGLKI